MTKSLQEQLLGAGLVKRNKAKALRNAQNVQRVKTTPEAEEAKRLAQQAREEKTLRDKELNQKKNEVAAQKALAAQITQLIQTHQISIDGGQMAYQFTDATKIKKIYVNALQHSQLVRGVVAIVKLPNVQDPSYFVLPRVIAEKIAQRDESLVVTLNTGSVDEVDEDDPYAAYQIPDDLMW
ncbi:MAG: DUF2058 domain-containing protein [Gammaproteobacteria bacterium]|jgi:uncharacterized protein YaiL (DUF2058 family)|nr:DUF2058 domain-containing protein [Gammaproteobacteria bacterium]MBQ0774423.1 DUF2058 domain-containing protein [Gammaproteobacteria bacterium]|tara:strand:- start:72477 stop:73019 length:543 start_codon:yes stop_codon:yes gene_type:complete